MSFCLQLSSWSYTFSSCFCHGGELRELCKACLQSEVKGLDWWSQVYVAPVSPSATLPGFQARCFL